MGGGPAHESWVIGAHKLGSPSDASTNGAKQAFTEQITAASAALPEKAMMYGQPARFLTLIALASLLTACNDESPLESTTAPQFSKQTAAENKAFATLRSATARYHNLKAATDDGFILLHGCEVRPGEGAVGVLYVNLERFLDGVIDPASPDGLLYAPGPDGKLQLTGVELAVPRSMWSAPQPPRFLGVTFQTEDEFDAYGLHIWVWRHNDNGMFAQSHSAVSCGEES